MDFELNEEQRALADSVKAFIDERVDPRMPEIERTNAIPPELLKEASDLGLFGISIPEEYGGSNLSRLSRVLVHQMLGRSGFGFAGIFAAHGGIGSEALVTIGTPEQKQRYLPRMATGELRGCFALTEPSAGSDAGGITTTAVKKGDRYILNGVKHYISGSTHAGLNTTTSSKSGCSRGGQG